MNYLSLSFPLTRNPQGGFPGFRVKTGPIRFRYRPCRYFLLSALIHCKEGSFLPAGQPAHCPALHRPCKYFFPDVQSHGKIHISPANNLRLRTASSHPGKLVIIIYLKPFLNNPATRSVSNNFQCLFYFLN